jgi:L-lactate dehydrogenase (cytochrome)
MNAADVLDFRALAKRKLPHFLFEYVDGGSYAEVTHRRNVSDLADVALRQRVLRDVSQLDLSTMLFGERIALPLALAPVGLAGMYARRGEVQAARAANGAGIPICVSTMSVCPLAEIADGAPGPIWFQLYFMRDKAFQRHLIETAREQGCKALVVTVDLPVPGARYRDRRSGFTGGTSLRHRLRRYLQAAARPRWAWDVGLTGRPHRLGNVVSLLGMKSGMEDFLAWVGANFDPGATWRELERVRQCWDGPLIVKGILEVEDAREALRCGADGIVVSNHGGRQLDGVSSTARALPAVADAVGSEITVLADGGIRSGLDLLRMLALGARGVLLGRAWVYGLAAGGEAGVRRVLGIVEAELRVAMALAGARDIASVDRALIAREASAVYLT